MILGALLRLPGVYPVAAFVLGRRAVVRGPSMRPTLAPGEYVLFDRLAYRKGPPRRGDIVLAAHPSRPGLRIVKRVVALAGDIVTIDGDRCWVNGVPCGAAAAGKPASGRRFTLAEGRCFLLGDDPHASTDARDFGPVEVRRLLGRAWLVYWPPDRMRVVRDDRTVGRDRV